MHEDRTAPPQPSRPVRRVVIVGGGTAGWLAACVIAARIDKALADPLTVTIIESPDIPTIGVGEGTWPTMRRTLERIGIAESDFLLACDASFKQGSRFIGWRTGAAGDSYLHPFTPPPEADPQAVVQDWAARADGPFADHATTQARICRDHLAPRQRAMPDYSGALNYGYHLDAGKLAALLTRRAQALGVRHLRDHVLAVERTPDGDIAGVVLRDAGAVSGDLFIDCTGHAAMLIGGALDVPFVDRRDILPNDRALAAQVPVAADSMIASQTDATAHRAGWIWDIGLPTRRGIGCVYASAFMDDDEAAEVLAAYIAQAVPGSTISPAAFRRLAFRSGHRARFWERNCLALGLSAGFLEPLEASAIVLIELSLDALLDDFPPDRETMAIQADRFNALFRERWDRIVEFLKLHYVLSERSEPYWLAHRTADSVPPRLAAMMRLWRHRAPSRRDLPLAEELFPAASYQYVLYGMGFPPPPPPLVRPEGQGAAGRLLRQVAERGRGLAASLPTNRAYLDALRAATAPASLETQLT
ncbi:hypothetical protein GGR88_000516 [Sphingomonas jejuensis]|uniref:Tryptophan halogenase n=1 Tax=Sphingomonas jejuensis TaxID=904715 RepID=A0ABX0XI81_9SPHN|nr:tryptophan halogenase family protein [Sphingomonas jejuensis]NJC33042.1 hypothetical protein [Sphingomonas jejuensis]